MRDSNDSKTPNGGGLCESRVGLYGHLRARYKCNNLIRFFDHGGNIYSRIFSVVDPWQALPHCLAIFPPAGISRTKNSGRMESIIKVAAKKAACYRLAEKSHFWNFKKTKKLIKDTVKRKTKIPMYRFRFFRTLCCASLPFHLGLNPI